MKNQKLFAAISAAIFAFGFNYLITDKWFPPSNTFNLTSHFSKPNTNTKKKNTIQVALLLDTSGSMNGLIEQAKSQLWQILNLLAKTEREQQETKLEIALYEYGNPGRSARSSLQIRKLSGFTSDMDLISKKLFALTTDGGEEYCGQVIQTSIHELEWGTDESNLKMIYIAGNEPFTQGPINYAEACQLAKKQNISVNTIFCGKYQEGVMTMWKQGAQLANGEYMNIDHNQVTTYIETPYDDKIEELNNSLNETYIPYNKKGKAKKENQRQQDSNAKSYSKANAADRAAFKSSKKYKAESWDLVDAYKKDKKVVEYSWSSETLPDTLQALSAEDLEAEIKRITVARETIQLEIQSVNQQRLDFIEKNSKKNVEGNDLKKSIENSVKKNSKGYKIKN